MTNPSQEALPSALWARDCHGEQLVYLADEVRPIFAALEQRVAALAAQRDEPGGRVEDDGRMWREAFTEQLAAAYRADGMKVEQARIHAEVRVHKMQAMLATHTGKENES